jgi:homospermidine synthase
VVRLAARHPRGAAARARQQPDGDPGRRRGARRRGLGGPDPTAIQVAAGALAAAVWAVRNPGRGYCEPEALPHDEVLAVARPYLGPMASVATDWTPLGGRGIAAPEPWLDEDDPWQFGNFLVG